MGRGKVIRGEVIGGKVIRSERRLLYISVS
jgi:hypothetical protein